MIILRFRDLSTEIGETIQFHKDIINTLGKVFWGWWMNPKEKSPKELFKKISTQIKETGSAELLLFDSGTYQFYSAKLIDLRVSPGNKKLGCPNPELTPSYYHSNSYPAWFLFAKIQHLKKPLFSIQYSDFPTRPNNNDLSSNIGRLVEEFEELADINVTLWDVELIEP